MKRPLSAGVKPSSTCNNPVTDCAGVTGALPPPMSVYTQPGHSATTLMPRGCNAKDNCTVAMFCAALLML